MAFHVSSSSTRTGSAHAPPGRGEGRPRDPYNPTGRPVPPVHRGRWRPAPADNRPAVPPRAGRVFGWVLRRSHSRVAVLLRKFSRAGASPPTHSLNSRSGRLLFQLLRTRDKQANGLYVLVGLYYLIREQKQRVVADRLDGTPKEARNTKNAKVRDPSHGPCGFRGWDRMPDFTPFR